MGYKYSAFQKWERKQHEEVLVNHITATVAIQAFFPPFLFLINRTCFQTPELFHHTRAVLVSGCWTVSTGPLCFRLFTSVALNPRMTSSGQKMKIYSFIYFIRAFPLLCSFQFKVFRLNTVLSMVTSSFLTNYMSHNANNTTVWLVRNDTAHWPCRDGGADRKLLAFCQKRSFTRSVRGFVHPDRNLEVQDALTATESKLSSQGRLLVNCCRKVRDGTHGRHQIFTPPLK